MAQIKQELLNWYRTNLAFQGKKAADAVLDILSKSGISDPIALRQYGVEQIQAALGIYGDNAQSLASEMYEYICKKQGFETEGELFDDIIDNDYIYKKMGYYTNNLQNGKIDIDEYNSRASELAKYLVYRSGFEDVKLNCDKDRIRWARVPSGTETCAFCYMLCSRGAVYTSKASAKYKSERNSLGVLETKEAKYHPHCDCIIIPCADGILDVAGIDFNFMGEMWRSEETWQKGCDVYIQKNGGREAFEAKFNINVDEFKNGPKGIRGYLHDPKTGDWKYMDQLVRQYGIDAMAEENGWDYMYKGY